MENSKLYLYLFLVASVVVVVVVATTADVQSSVKPKNGTRRAGRDRDRKATKFEDVSDGTTTVRVPMQRRNKPKSTSPPSSTPALMTSTLAPPPSTPPSSSSSSSSSRPRHSKKRRPGRPDGPRMHDLEKVVNASRGRQKSPNWWGVWSDRSSVNRRLGQQHHNKKRMPRCHDNTEIHCPNKCLPLVDICDGYHDCQDGRDEANCEEMEVKLMGGSRAGEGRVEVTINNITGTICSLGWSDRAARVICRMFGFENPSQAKAVTNGKFGKGSGVIWLSQVACSGTESDLNECLSPVWGDHGCTHDDDAGVVCNPKTESRKNDRRGQSKSSDQTCGRRPIQQSHSRILGGKTTVYGAVPWQARVLKVVGGDAFHQCGGTIVDRRWIVTAAHCVEELSTASIRVSVGDHDTTKTDPREQLFRVDRVVIHPEYKTAPFRSSERWLSLMQIFNLKSSDEFVNDIALIKLRSNEGRFIEFNSHVQPACLPSPSTPYRPGLKCEISGWGLISNEPMRIPDKLQYGVVPIMSTYDCEKSYRGLFLNRLPSQMFCAGFAQGSVDTCQGDSGGPLVCSIHGTHTLMGVTSWGFECGKKLSPGIYTKVGVVSSWISGVIRGKS